MQEKPPGYEPSNFGRRATDHGTQDPTLKDVYLVLQDIQAHLKRIDRAFPLDDLKEPGYDAHRQEHIDNAKSRNTVEKFKVDTAVKTFAAATVALLAFMSTGFITHIKTAVSSL